MIRRGLREIPAGAAWKTVTGFVGSGRLSRDSRRFLRRSRDWNKRIFMYLTIYLAVSVLRMAALPISFGIWALRHQD